LVVAVLCAGAIVALGFYVDSLETNFPNVWINNIDVSQLSIAETTQRLIDSGFEENAVGIAVTIVFPDETSFTVSGDDVGLSLDAAEAARNAFEFGRSESFFGNAITYANSRISRTDLTNLNTPQMDSSIVSQFADEYAVQFNATLLDNELEITEDSIIIAKGSGFSPASSEDVFDLAISTLMLAVEEHEHITAEYVPAASDADDFVDLSAIFEYVHIDVVSSRFDIESRSVIESVHGRSFDLAEAERMVANATYGETVVIPIYTIEPEYTTEEIEALLFRDVLGQSTTTMTNNANRTRNIELTVEHIADTVLYPGDIFSFNDIVGQRTAARGFQEAMIIADGRFVPGLGGGICQTSSTIFDALLRTTLEVVERRNHRLTVNYLPPGRDATVAWGQTDFRFRNNSDFPVRVEAEINGLELTVRLIGTRLEDYRIEIEGVILSRTNFSVVERITDDLEPGQTYVFSPGMNGVTAEIFQRKYNSDGELISRTSVGISVYNPQQRIIYVGRQPPPVYDPEPPPSEPIPEPPEELPEN